MILFEEIIDVIFPSLFLVFQSFGWSIQQLFFTHLSLGDVAILDANFHFIFLCVLFQHRIFACSILSIASAVLLLM